MILGNRIHVILLVLYGIIVLLAVWGVVCQTSYISRMPSALWAAIGTVGASGAMIEVLLHLRTREALKLMKNQIQKLSVSAEVGLVMIEEQWPVEGIAGILNEYLTLIRGRMNKLDRERKDLDLLVQAVDVEKQNTEAIVRSISDAVLVVNSFGELTLANRQAEVLFGFEFAKHQNHPIEDVVSEPIIAAMLNPERWRDREPNPADFEYVHEKVGSEKSKSFAVTVTPVFINDHELWALAMTLRDVTRERELSQMKTDFVHQVSHELRTPLSSIKAYTELLIDGDIKTAEGRNDFYRIIQSEAERLDRFIENMLNLSRIESGLMPREFVQLRLDEELRQALNLVRYVAQEKSLILDYVSPSPDIQVWADRDLLRQVVLNLLSNAIKYTRSGGMVTLDAGLDSDSHFYRICVRDTGVGIAPGEMQRIFEKFYRSESGKRLSGGTGLGLSLVKRVVEQIHGGTVHIESTPGVGSSFTVRLPVKPMIVGEQEEPVSEAVAV